MHILVLPSYYPSIIRPYMGIFFQQQAEALHRAGHKVGVLVAPRIRETLHYVQHQHTLPNLKTASVETDIMLPVYRMHWGWFPRVFPRFCAWLTAPAGFRAFSCYCEENGTPDVIHAHNIFYGGYMAVRIREKFGVPVVLTEHSSNFLRGRIFLPGQHTIARYTLKGMNAAFAVGPVLSARLTEYHAIRPVGVIPNIVNTDFFSPGGSVSHPFTFAVITIKLIPLKGIDILLNAFAKVFRRQAVRLLVVGDGGDRTRLELLAQQLGVTTQVEFRGQLPREQVRDVLRQSQVIVSSSYIETFGITLVEAMACGKPVVATQSGGPEYFVNERNGLLVPSGDVDALAAALCEMVENYSRFDASAIRAECVANYSEAAVVSKLEAVYDQVVHQA